MKKLLRYWLAGSAEICEYPTVTVDNAIVEHVFLRTRDKILHISETHGVFCLRPIVFGIWLADEDARAVLQSDSPEINFCNPGSPSRIHDVVARGKLKYVDQIVCDGGSLLLFRLEACRIYHLNFIKTRALYLRYYKKPTLDFAGFTFLVTAYSYPRWVRIVSFRDEGFYIIFPMDLLGEIPTAHKQIFGLRHTNITLQKIIHAGKIAIAEVPFRYKDIIYELGKHHGSNPPVLASLPFGTIETANWGFYLPEWAESYKEIEITRSIDLGSHMLLWGDIVYEHRLKESSGNLYHIHFLEWLCQRNKGKFYPLV